MVCRFRALKKVKFINVHLAVIRLTMASRWPGVPVPRLIARVMLFCTLSISNVLSMQRIFILNIMFLIF